MKKYGNWDIIKEIKKITGEETNYEIVLKNIPLSNLKIRNILAFLVLGVFILVLGVFIGLLIGGLFWYGKYSQLHQEYMQAVSLIEVLAK